MAYVDSGNISFVEAAIEAFYVAVDSHSVGCCCIGAITTPFGADGDICRIVSAYYPYGCVGEVSFERETYLLAVLDGKGNIAFHVYCLCLSCGTEQKPREGYKKYFLHKSN